MNSSIASDVLISCAVGDNGRQILVNKFPDQLTFVNHVAACLFSVLNMVATIILNSLTFATFWSSPKMRKSTSLFLVMILSGHDAVGGLASNTVFTVRLASEVFGTVGCGITFARAVSIVITANSLVAVTAINIERYVGVIHPMYHRSQLKKSTLFKFIMLFWIAGGIAFALSFIYGYIIVVRLAAVICSGFILFTMFAYTRIGIEVTASERKRQNLSPSSANDQCQTRKKHANFLKEIKLAKSCFMIVICYVLCSTPVIAFMEMLRKSLSVGNLIIANAWCVNLLLLNSSLNSVIFFWRSRELRKETICLLKKMNIFNKT